MAKNSNEIGATGLAQFSGRIQEDFLRELRGLEGYRKFNEMRLNSPVVGSLLLAVRMPILAMDWTFSSDTEGDPRLEICNASLENMSYSILDHITESLSFLWAGYCPFEIVYERGENGWMLWRKFAPRGQDTVTRWQFSEDGGLEGFYQRVNYTGEVFIPMEKTLLYRINVERNNPEGRSMLRAAWTSYYYAKYISQSEAIGLERGMDGFPVITLPEGASVDPDDSNSDAAKAAEFVRNIRNDEQAGMVLPFGWELELLAPGAQSRLDADKVIRRYESRILMSALAQFLNLGQEGIGSLSLSRDQTDFFAMALNATADVISETITKYALPRLMKLNGYDAEGLSLTHSPATQEDIVQIGTVLSQLGQYLDLTAEDQVWLRQILKMPERKVEDIQADMEDKQARKDAMAEALKQNIGKPKEEDQQPPDDKTKLTISRYAASAPDDAERRKMEKRIKKIVLARLEKKKSEVMKYAKEARRA